MYKALCSGWNMNHKVLVLNRENMQGRIQTLWEGGVPAMNFREKGVGVLGHYLLFFVNFTNENDKFYILVNRRGANPLHPLDLPLICPMSENIYWNCLPIDMYVSDFKFCLLYLLNLNLIIEQVIMYVSTADIRNLPWGRSKNTIDILKC